MSEQNNNCAVKNCKYKKLHGLLEKINQDYEDYIKKNKIINEIKDIVSKDTDTTIKFDMIRDILNKNSGDQDGRKL
jgi:hypothetical protein